MRSLIPWAWPKKETSLTEEANDWFHRVLDVPLRSLNLASDRFLSAGWPVVDIAEGEKDVTVKLEVPGMEQKDLELAYHNGMLTVKGEKKDEKETQNKNTYYRESWQGSFCRSIPLGNNLDWDQACAKYKNGDLTVTIPKKEVQETNKIKIDVNA